MADDTRDSEVSKTVIPSGSTDHPNSVVLGKDGKPSSAAFSSWASKAKKASKLPGTPVTTIGSTSPSRECPPDVEALGRASWTLLHSITASYPVDPSPSQKTEVVQFLKLFAKFYPCWVCATDFDAYIEKKHVRADSRDELGVWMCEAHNSVNIKLGKNTFDCQKWEERWRTGWKDGSCD